MIDEKKIEEAAEKYAERVKEPMVKGWLASSFKAGVNWFLDNLWHDAMGKPKRGSRIFVEKIFNGEKRYTDDSRNTLYSSWQYKVSRENITRWLYVDDLLKGGSHE